MIKTILFFTLKENVTGEFIDHLLQDLVPEIRSVAELNELVMMRSQNNQELFCLEITWQSWQDHERAFSIHQLRNRVQHLLSFINVINEVHYEIVLRFESK